MVLEKTPPQYNLRPRRSQNYERMHLGLDDSNQSEVRTPSVSQGRIVQFSPIIPMSMAEVVNKSPLPITTETNPQSGDGQGEAAAASASSYMQPPEKSQSLPGNTRVTTSCVLPPRSTFDSRARGQTIIPNSFMPQNFNLPPPNSYAGVNSVMGASGYNIPPPHIPSYGGPPMHMIHSASSQEDLTRLITQVVTTVLQAQQAINKDNVNHSTSANKHLNNVNILSSSISNVNGQDNNNIFNPNNQNNNFNYGGNCSLFEVSKIMPEFDNENTLQPLDFLQILESSIDVQRVPFNNIKFLLNNSFKNSAKLWWDAFSDTIVTYCQFRKEFVEYFWPPKKQQQIRNKLETTEYREGDGLFVDHFNYWVAISKHLQPPYTPEQLIEKIAPHFPPNVAGSLLGATSLSQALARLRHADEYYKNSPLGKKKYFMSYNKDTDLYKNAGPSKHGLRPKVFDKNVNRNISNLDLEEEAPEN